MIRATITINDIASEMFHVQGVKIEQGFMDILERLQRQLQDKGDDPRYTRVLFAAEGQDRYAEIRDSYVRLEGVFPRSSAVWNNYDRHKQETIHNALSRGESDDVLIVTDTKKEADEWKLVITESYKDLRVREI